MSNELLEKVITTSTIGATGGPGGLLNTQQSGQFIDYLWNATTLGSQVRTIRMRADSVELDRMAIGERLVRLATEAVDDALAVAVAFTKVSLSTEKLRLDWELSSESLEDGLEGEALEDHIARLMAAQAANDLEDLAINGDSLGKSHDALLKSFDGWRKRLYGGGHVIDGAAVPVPSDGTAVAGTLHKGVFNAALRALPRQYSGRRGSLKFFTIAGLVQDFVYQNSAFTEVPGGFSNVSVPANDVGPGPAAGWSPAAPYGVGLQEVPLFPEYEVGGDTASDVWLVDPKNLIWGVKREIQVFREFVPRKDTIEYTMYTRVGCTVENPLASVVVKNVKFVN